jgi:hypothetical protein
MVVEGTSRWIADFGDVSAIRFRRGATEALIADRGAHAVYIARSLDTTPSLSPLVEDLIEPVALGFTGGGAKAVIADAGARALVLIDLETGSRSLLPCECTPAGLEDVDGTFLFRVIDRASDGMVLVDANGGRLARAVRLNTEGRQ